ncbi:hypothetical protein X777_01340 [Ooceraea biroi]|uniref:Uncharacterized protein n=1 Tax=Ooceraea biroi TaxID=2015173 RepID=A0A026WQZ0_OOCBI|nr:hypothetical protein X777_01340 [Ooceraea biroi]
MCELAKDMSELETMNRLLQLTERVLQRTKDDTKTCVATQIESITTAIRSTMHRAFDQHFATSKNFKTIINASYTHYQKALNVHASIAMEQINEKNKLLMSINAKLAPDISDLSRCNESFVQNLQILNNNITQKLESASAYVNLAVETICRNYLQECNNLHKSLNEIREQINCMSRNEKQVMENYKILAKKMGDLSHGLNLLNNCESSYSDNITKYHQIDKICSKMCDQTLKNYDADVQVLNKIAIDRGVISVSDLQERLSTGRATLKQYNNIQFNEKQLQQKMLKNKSTMLTSSAVCNNIVKTVENMCFPRVRLLEQWQNKILDFSKCIDDKFTIQSVESSNWNNDMLQKLHASQQQIDKFSLKPFGRDTSIADVRRDLYIDARHILAAATESPGHQSSEFVKTIVLTYQRTSTVALNTDTNHAYQLSWQIQTED